MKRCQCFSKSLEDRAGVSVDAGIMKEWAGRTLTLLKNKIKFWIPSGKPLCNKTGWGLIGQEAALPMGQELSIACLGSTGIQPHQPLQDPEKKL